LQDRLKRDATYKAQRQKLLEDALLAGRITIEVYDRLMADLLKRSIEDRGFVAAKDLLFLHDDIKRREYYSGA
jgi:hypothetical protein